MIREDRRRNRINSIALDKNNCLETLILLVTECVPPPDSPPAKAAIRSFLNAPNLKSVGIKRDYRMKSCSIEIQQSSSADPNMVAAALHRTDEAADRRLTASGYDLPPPGPENLSSLIRMERQDGTLSPPEKTQRPFPGDHQS